MNNEDWNQLTHLANGNFSQVDDGDGDDDDDEQKFSYHVASIMFKKEVPNSITPSKKLMSEGDGGAVQATPPKKSKSEADGGAVQTDSEPTVVIVGNKKTTIKDFHIEWKGNKKKNKPITHEVTYDMVNGFDTSTDDHSLNYCYVSGYSCHQIARVNIENPSIQQLFRFDLYDKNDGKKIMATPHTLRFSETKGEKGMLWVALEDAGRIVKVNMISLIKRYEEEGIEKGDALSVTKDDFITYLNVKIKGIDGSTPYPINPRPHGFCFNKEGTHIWFTGKLTNTVGCVEISTRKVKHYQLPTYGGLPIYLALDSYGDVWGTCLSNNNVFRVSTKDGIVTELSITPYAAQSRPVTIKKDPKNEKYMWFATEAGHSVCRINIEKLNQALETEKNRKAIKAMLKKGDVEGAEAMGSSCVCSKACKKIYKRSEMFNDVITTYVIPGGQNFILADLAFDRNHDLWVQSYYNAPHGIASKPPPDDSIIKIDKAILDNDVIDGVFISAYKVPTNLAVLHRMTEGPSGKMLFTEQFRNKIGILKVEELTEHDQQMDNASSISDQNESNKKRKASAIEE